MLDQSTRVAQHLYASLDTPRALACSILLRHKEFGQLVTMTTDPQHYLDGSVGARMFKRDAQATDFFRKSPLLPTGINRKEVAIKSYHDAEDVCHQTNQYLSLLRYPSTGELPMDGAFRKILAKAGKVARRVLGPLPEKLDICFGPGTSFEFKGGQCNTVVDKLWTKPLSTPKCIEIFEHYFWPSSWGREYLALGLPLPDTIPGNYFTTVPKDAKTDRGICVEPMGNLAMQLSVGRYMKGRLGRIGIHVEKNHDANKVLPFSVDRFIDGQDLHRAAARKGSLDGSLATIDLSSASDTISIELVRWILPPDWFALLDSLRSPRTLIEGEWYLNEKFSSMGNGFTFELETLLFGCLLEAVGCGTLGQDVLVYGDDMIINADHFSEAQAVLRASGFILNAKKSYHQGPFRESCGGDYFSGVPVRSYFQKSSDLNPLVLVDMHNQLFARGFMTRRLRAEIVSCIPSFLRLYGPPGESGVIWTTSRPPKLRTDRNNCQFIKYVRARGPKLGLDRWHDGMALPAMLLGYPTMGVSPRGAVVSYTASWRFY